MDISMIHGVRDSTSIGRCSMVYSRIRVDPVASLQQSTPFSSNIWSSWTSRAWSRSTHRWRVHSLLQQSQISSWTQHQALSLMERYVSSYPVLNIIAILQSSHLHAPRAYSRNHLIKEPRFSQLSGLTCLHSCVRQGLEWCVLSTLWSSLRVFRSWQPTWIWRTSCSSMNMDMHPRSWSIRCW